MEEEAQELLVEMSLSDGARSSQCMCVFLGTMLVSGEQMLLNVPL